MSKRTIPPELVEKIESLVRKTIIENSPINVCAEQFAQIAVDHADEQNLFLKTEVNFLDEEVNILKQQRDELIELLEETVLHIEYLNYKFQETGSGNSLLTRIKSKLKKHEDGKE